MDVAFGAGFGNNRVAKPGSAGMVACLAEPGNQPIGGLVARWRSICATIAATFGSCLPVVGIGCFRRHGPVGSSMVGTKEVRGFGHVQQLPGLLALGAATPVPR